MKTAFQIIIRSLAVFSVLPNFILLMATSASPVMAKKPVPLSMEIPYGQLTLTRAQQVALEASPVVAGMLARIEEAQAIAKQKSADLWPTISVQAGHDWNDSSAFPDWSPETRVNESYRHVSTGIQINYLLFDGLSRRASILAAKARIKQSKKLSDEARRLLAESVATAYYQAQLAAEAMQITRQNALFNRDLEHDAEKRYLAGDIPEAEYLNFSVKSLQAENDFLKGRQAFSIICTMLAKLMALPEPRLTREMYPVAAERITALAKLPTLADELDYARQHRPDFLALSAQKEALLQDRRKNRGSYFPKVYAYGSFDYDTYEDYGSTDQDEHDSSVGVSVNWDLYDGGRRSAKILATDAQIKQLQRKKEQKLLEIQAAIQQALFKAKSSRAVYQRECYTLTLVQKIRDHVERSYKVGATTLTRLNEAQTDLVSVSAAVVTSRINYLQQLEVLRATSGRILSEL